MNIAIVCARCGTIVDRWETWHDDFMNVQRYRAYCHGEVDDCAIDWRQTMPNEIVRAEAFTTKKLDHAGSANE